MKISLNYNVLYCNFIINLYLIQIYSHIWLLKTQIAILKGSKILKQHMCLIYTIFLPPSFGIQRTITLVMQCDRSQIAGMCDDHFHIIRSIVFLSWENRGCLYCMCCTLCTSVSSWLLFPGTKQEEHRCLAVRHSTLWSGAQTGLAGWASCNMSCILNNLYTDEHSSDLHTLILREEPQTRLSINNEAPRKLNTNNFKAALRLSQQLPWRVQSSVEFTLCYPMSNSTRHWGHYMQGHRKS
jgi:hypothetical protein